MPREEHEPPLPAKGRHMSDISLIRTSLNKLYLNWQRNSEGNFAYCLQSWVNDLPTAIQQVLFPIFSQVFRHLICFLVIYSCTGLFILPKQKCICGVLCCYCDLISQMLQVVLCLCPGQLNIAVGKKSRLSGHLLLHRSVPVFRL